MKTKERSIKELLTILRDNLDTTFKIYAYCGGLCSAIHCLSYNDTITTDERNCLIQYLNDNTPRNAKIRQKRFQGTLNLEGWSLGLHWWKPRALKPRINWLNKQIDKL
jgi:hypothetical protein